MKEPLLPCPFKPPFEIEDVRGGGEYPEPDNFVIRDSSGMVVGCADSGEEGIWILNALNDACHRSQSPPVAQGQQSARNELKSLTGTGTNNPHKPQPKEPELINSACLQCREYELNDIPQLKDEFIKVMKYVEVYRRALEEITNLSTGDCGDWVMKARWIAERAIEKALLTSKPEPVAQGQEERDYTPEEALAEAMKRWGIEGVAEWVTKSYPPRVMTYRVGKGNLGPFHYGASFREAFLCADKAESDRGGKE